MTQSFAHLDRLRRGATVTRYHTHRVVRRQNVGEHSHGVAIIALYLLGPAPDEKSAYYVMRAALEHDLAEFDSGDSPAPAKRRSPELRRVLDQIEDATNSRLGLTAAKCLEPFEGAIVGVSDELEFLFYSIDERRLGNVDFERTFALGIIGCRERLSKHALTFPGEWVVTTENVMDGMERTMRELIGEGRYLLVMDRAIGERESGR